MELQHCTSAPHRGILEPSENVSLFCSGEIDRKETALQRFQGMLYEFIRLIQDNRHSLNTIVEDGMRAYQTKTDEMKGLKESQGSVGFKLTLAGAALTALMPFISHLDSTSLDFKEFVNLVGGVEAVRKLLETGSTAAEGFKPVASAWSDAKQLPEQVVKEFLEVSFRRGQEAERHSQELVDQLTRLADKVYDTYSETRYGS